MLIKLTTHCTMGCLHCMEDATPDGVHMRDQTFEQVLDFLGRVSSPFVMLSGGEPTDHPHILSYIKELQDRNIKILLMSNGLFMYDEALCRTLLNSDILIQIINDLRYYPRRVPKPPDHVVFDTKINAPLAPFGRALVNNIPVERLSPTCFNFRSLMRSGRDFRACLNYLWMMGRFCTPSITHEGYIVAGESRFCSSIGHVTSTDEELTEAACSLTCSNCGLVNNLNSDQKRAIGESEDLKEEEVLKRAI